MTTPYIMYIVSRNDNLFTLSANWPENLTTDSLFSLFLKLVQINLVFCDYVLYI